MDLKSPPDLESHDLTALVGSRICHDLISPLGAIGNGVELLMMSGATPGPEIALICQSVRSANARIRLFRVAFGSCAVGQFIGRVEVLGILDDMTSGSRLEIDWQGPADLKRAEVKLGFLALLCCETAMPYGGQIAVSVSAEGWLIEATAERFKIDSALWVRLAGQRSSLTLAAAHVQFALFADEARRQGRIPRISLGEARIDLRL